MSLHQRLGRLERRVCKGREAAWRVVTLPLAVRRLHEAGVPVEQWPWPAQAYAQERMEFRAGAWYEVEGGKERP